MGVRNAKQEELRRLDCKTLDAQFKTTIRDGLNCSPFEAEAVLQVMHEVYRIFFVSPRTISRDLQALRKANPKTPIPLRSMVHDLGPVLTHRTQIVCLALEGKTTSQICQIMRHSPAAVANYLSTFTRCAQLAKENMQAGQIAFLLRRGKGLIQRYLELLKECRRDKNLRYHLEELLKIGQAGAWKKGAKETPR